MTSSSDPKSPPGAADPASSLSPSGHRSWAAAGLDTPAREALASGLPASEVWSLLMEVLEARAARTAASLREQWEQDRFVQPCHVDARAMLDVDRQLFAAAAEFEALELSPVAPLGACSSVALASQNKIVSTARGTEVVSDPTNVLALECARRLRDGSRQPVRLATSHRCVRAQAVPKRPGFAAHFRMFCLASAGHERENRELTSSALAEHINTHIAALDLLERNGYAVAERVVRIFSIERNAELANRVAGDVRGARVEHETLDHAYYDGIRFMIDVQAPDGARLPLIDGGAFDWLRKLMSNRKIVFVASGMGSQVLASVFRR
jgi:hypothetical protein